ncbi:hypothetical protein J7J26_00170 [Candidatus Micrarchaeota archaeon]|nr:hypothetical protein [Candidatus Micrarchaeota archaeon]
MERIFILDSSILLMITERKLNVIEYIIDNFGISNIKIILPYVVKKELISMKNKPGKLILDIINEYIKKGIVKEVKNIFGYSLPRTKYADLWILEYIKANKDKMMKGKICIYVCTTDTLLKKQSRNLGAKAIILRGKSTFSIV